MHPPNRTPNNPPGVIRNRDIKNHFFDFIPERQRYFVPSMLCFCFPSGLPYEPTPLTDPTTVEYSYTDIEYWIEQEVGLVFLEVYFLLLSSFARSSQQQVPYEKGRKRGDKIGRHAGKCLFLLFLSPFYRFAASHPHPPFACSVLIFYCLISLHLMSSYIFSSYLIRWSLPSGVESTSESGPRSYCSKDDLQIADILHLLMTSRRYHHFSIHHTTFHHISVISLCFISSHFQSLHW